MIHVADTFLVAVFEITEITMSYVRSYMCCMMDCRFQFPNVLGYNLGVSINWGTSSHPFRTMGFSITNQAFWGSPIDGNPHLWGRKLEAFLVSSESTSSRTHLPSLLSASTKVQSMFRAKPQVFAERKQKQSALVVFGGLGLPKDY